MIERDEHSALIVRALGHYNKIVENQVKELDNTNSLGMDFLKRDIQDLPKDITKCLDNHKKTSDLNFTAFLKDNKDLLCNALTCYVRDLNLTKDNFLSKFGVPIETYSMDTEIKVALELKRVICHSPIQ